MKLIWPSPAKINLFLYILNKRRDHYHEIQTFFQLINYCDFIYMKFRNDDLIKLHTLDKRLNKKNNLIIKAAFLLKQYIIEKNEKNYCRGIDIYLNKNIPIGSGLGGGSSNAATTLIALNYYWKSNINNKEFLILAKKLGADVPLFIKGRTGFAEGIGEKIIPIKLKKKWYLILYPKLEISTLKIFSNFKFKKRSYKFSLIELLNKPYHNDFEKIVRDQFPKVEALFSWLSQYKSCYLTGTGSSVFAEFYKKEKKIAYKLLNKIPNWVFGFVSSSMNKSTLNILRKNI
ncbi:MAG: 4-(cytidine 5'-diphospho)-2-C-methyl-D-erythritol kinase [Arsenophonus sp.]|nr:MAG: 4-(cytidine 5'-diphospho)-2-C-methyl-D-erythritol kinase [Arsenophonus sp.]